MLQSMRCSCCISFYLDIIIYHSNILPTITVVQAISQVFQCILCHRCLNWWYSINVFS